MNNHLTFTEPVTTDVAIESAGSNRFSKSGGGGIYQTLVLKTLERMTLGCMNLELPDGTRRTIGQPGATITANVRIVNPALFKRCALFGDIGLGEGYIAGDWETDDITQVISWFILNIEKSIAQSSQASRAMVNLLSGFNRLKHLLRPNSLRTSKRNIAEHYDLGNDFYKLWLDETMTYSSAMFSSPEQSLEEAQTAKYDALCKRLRLVPSDHVLEIGSGWGGFACHAAKNYGCRITTVTISEEQYKYARERFEREGVSDRVEARLQDYRLITGKFDKIASIEMMEALGDKYLETYFAKIDELLKRDGLVAVQYITVPDSKHEELKSGVDFIQKHIFPGSLLLSIGRVNEALNSTGDLFLNGLEDFGKCYAKTLRLWRETFNAKLNEVRALGFDDRFIRKWNYYLCYCEAAFDMRNISVVQAVYTRPNNLKL